MTPTIEYVPGVCNIGPAEIKRRMMVGYWGTVIALVLFVALYSLHLPDWTRIILAVPAFMGATGFIQGLTHFCAGFGMSGVFNFGSLGTTQKVGDSKAAAKDRQKALALFGYSLLIAIAVTAIAYVI